MQVSSPATNNTLSFFPPFLRNRRAVFKVNQSKINTMTLREEMLSEILDTLGVSLTEQQIITIAKDFSDGLEMEREINQTPFMFIKSECEKCKILKERIAEFEKKGLRLSKHYSCEGRGNIKVDKDRFIAEYFNL